MHAFGGLWVGFGRWSLVSKVSYEKHTEKAIVVKPCKRAPFGIAEPLKSQPFVMELWNIQFHNLTAPPWNLEPRNLEPRNAEPDGEYGFTCHIKCCIIH